MDERRLPFGANSPLSWVERSDDPMIAWDAQHRLRDVNRAAVRLWGIAKIDAIGRPVGDLVSKGLETVPGQSDVGERQVVIEHFGGYCTWTTMKVEQANFGVETLTLATIPKTSAEQIVEGRTQILSLIASSTDRAIIITDEQRRIIYTNDAFVRLFGYESRSVSGLQPFAFLAGPQTDPQIVERLAHDRVRRDGFEEHILLYDKDGGEVWVSAAINSIFDGDGAMTHSVAILWNVTEEKWLQILQRDVLEALARDRPLEDVAELVCERVEAVAPDVICSILRVDQEKRLRPFGGSSLPENYSKALDGLPIGPMVGSCGTAAYRGEPVLVEDIANDPLWADYRDLPLPLGLLACWSSPIKLEDGSVAGTFAFYFREKKAPSRWHKRLVDACVHLCVLAIERHEAKLRIAQLAYYDSLTGLPNRTMLRDKIKTMMKCAAQKTQEAAFLFIDVDHFKDVNDTLGHTAGDGVLVQIARRLRGVLGPQDVAGRLGGDEFVVLLSNCDAKKAAATAKRIVDVVAEPIHVNGSAIYPSISIGISLYPVDGSDAEKLLSRADAAMYEAKKRGRRATRFFSPEMNRLAQERLTLVAALRQGVTTGGLQLQFQPQINFATKRLHGVEALARWRHAAYGEVSPARFIALAEENGMIDVISEWVVGEACSQLADWRERNLDIPRISINLSPLNFRNPELPGLIAAALKRHGLPGEMLTLEITEGVMMDHSAVTAASLAAIQAMDVRLALDDFGTGYSSLSSIVRLPVAELKIDQTFIAEIDGGHSARTVVSAVIQIGKSLGLTVVAEGVESDQQMQFLQSKGCDVGQGFWFAPALDAAALEHWLTRLAPTGAGRPGAGSHQVQSHRPLS